MEEEDWTAGIVFIINYPVTYLVLYVMLLFLPSFLKIVLLLDT